MREPVDLSKKKGYHTPEPKEAPALTLILLGVAILVILLGIGMYRP